MPITQFSSFSDGLRGDQRGALIFFVIHGGLIYLDKPEVGSFAAYDDAFTALEVSRAYYRESGLDPSKLDQLVR